MGQCRSYLPRPHRQRPNALTKDNVLTGCIPALPVVEAEQEHEKCDFNSLEGYIYHRVPYMYAWWKMPHHSQVSEGSGILMYRTY